MNMPLHDWTAAVLLIAVGAVHRQDFQAMAWAFMLSPACSAHSSATWKYGSALPNPTRGFQSESCFRYSVVLNIIALLGLIGTLKLRAKTST
jgi:hypothetical protein